MTVTSKQSTNSKTLSPKDIKDWKFKKEAVIPDGSLYFFNSWIPSEDALLSPEIIDLLGYRPEEFSGQWFNHIHPQDWVFYATEICKSFAAHETFTQQYRLQKKDGSYALIEDYCEPIVDAQGNIINTIGYIIEASK